MQTRREFVRAAGVVAGGQAVLGCGGGGSARYQESVSSTWRHSRDLRQVDDVQRELVRYATLAPSSHNSQCWKFEIGDGFIAIHPDLSRQLPVVDPDDHHLYASVGCAAENLSQAALATGLHADVSFDAGSGVVVRVDLEPTAPSRTPLFDAIPSRQSTRAEYDGQPLSSEDLALLAEAGRGDGVDVLLVTDSDGMEAILEYVVEGNTAQVNDREFVRELKEWIRFNPGEAVRTGDGLYTGSSGNPTVPAWLGGLMFDLFFDAEGENEKYAEQVRSSAGIAVFVSDEDDKRHWVEAGRCFERFALQATALGIRNAHLNQPVEVPELRPQFASYLGIAPRRPDLVVRFGRGPELPRSLRRPLGEVLI